MSIKDEILPRFIRERIERTIDDFVNRKGQRTNGPALVQVDPSDLKRLLGAIDDLKAKNKELLGDLEVVRVSLKYNQISFSEYSDSCLDSCLNIVESLIAKYKV